MVGNIQGVIHGSVNAHFGGEERLEMAVELGTKAAEGGQSERRLLQRREGSQSPEPAGAGPVNFTPLPGTWIQLCHQTLHWRAKRGGRHELFRVFLSLVERAILFVLGTKRT